MTNYPSSIGIEYTIRRTCFGSPVIYVRTTRPVHMGSWAWRSWRRANDTECNDVLMKLMELNNE